MNADPTTARLSEFICATTYDGLPTRAVEHARLCLLETIGAMVGGARVGHVRHLAGFARHTSPEGPATLLGFGGKTSTAMAALTNGCSATALEMVGGYRWAFGMPGIAAIPTALALGEELHRSGKELVEAVVVGFDVGARASVAAAPWKDAFHPHGSLSMIGAAVAAGRMRRFDADQTGKLLDVASLLPIFAHRKVTFEGGTAHNIYPAMSALNGLLASEFMEAGITGARAGLRDAFGAIVAQQQFREELLTKDLGEPYLITRNYFKPYACDRHLHPALDAFQQAMGPGPVDPSSIERIDVHSYFRAWRCREQNPANFLAARWSIPHALAALMVYGHASWEAFTDEAVRDPRVQPLRQIVEVYEDKSYTALDPDQKPARVIVHLKDGSRREAEVLIPKGDFDNPSTLEEMLERFHRAVGGVLDPDAAEQTAQLILNVESVGDVNHLTEVINSGCGRG